MKKQIAALLLSFIFLCSFSLSAGAAEIDNAAVGADSDLTIVAADYAEVGTTLEPADPLPMCYSSQAEGFTTPVRSQLYNTCWAYSSTATFESALLKRSAPSTHLSTMHMNYWGCMNENGNGWQRTYTSAGYPYISLGYLTSFGCIRNNLFEEYRSFDEFVSTQNSLYPYWIADSVIYLNGNDRDTIKTAIYKYGGAVGNFHYSAAFWNSETASYFCDTPGLLTSQLNGHAIELVGWDDNYSTLNFTADHRPAEAGAWLCKNSYGEAYGLNGYFWISYEDLYLFESRFGPSYSISNVSPMTAVTKMQQNEIYGAVYEFNYIQQLRPNLSKITYANVFDFSDGYHNIDKVVFESRSVGSDYSVYYIPIDDSTNKPVTNENQWFLLAQGTISYQGYIGAECYGFDAPAEKGAIGVRIEKDGATDISIGADEWLSSGGRKLFIPESEHQQSYIIGYTINAMDLMDFYSNKLNDNIGGTFVIKALCTSDEEAGDVDRDGKFNICDVTYSQRALIHYYELDNIQNRFADFDNDGTPDTVDCTRMQRSLVSLPN